jgi:chitin disaccharide deacetylase
VKFLIITADDFGLHPSVNQAVEAAHSLGVLTSASLMVGAAASDDAVARAQRLPGLRVGLHVVVADGRATLPPARLAGLADPDGWLSADMLSLGVRLLRRAVRHQLEMEIRAQFERFMRCGLRLDHVNVHKHGHVNPMVLALLLKVAGDFGRPPLRLPREPPRLTEPGNLLIAPWLGRMRRRCRQAGMQHNDTLFGIADTGRMDEARLLRTLARLPSGVTEIYSHPASSQARISEPMARYRHYSELQALLSSRVRAAVAATGAVCGGYRDAFPDGVTL